MKINFETLLTFLFISDSVMQEHFYQSDLERNMVVIFQYVVSIVKCIMLFKYTIYTQSTKTHI